MDAPLDSHHGTHHGGHPAHPAHPVHHDDPGGAGGPLEASATLLVVTVLLVAAAGYLLAVRRARRRNPVQGWSAWRTASFLGGLAVVAVALLPPLGPAAHTDFRGHMAQHMLIGMYAPPALVLAAPVTLALRALSPAGARRITALLHSRPARLITHPAVALALSTGTLGLLYFTPLYGAAMGHPAGHWLMNAHFLASGCLFAHAVAGPDPAPARPGVPARLVYLGIAITAHALIAQAMYGGFFVRVHAPVDQVRQGAEIMYYAGDLAELLLAAALVATWRPERRSRRERPAPGSARAGSGSGGLPVGRPVSG
ncbi:putative membrane protein [Streptomyces ambofaciens ATCC 23877]|uniref:Putative membrane protein n=1 Tax=Streptomyces ambofaciens (strain ATCC 23877 / 3486 / DSM 40053 / JCM 4204 / NBRC 12836 / NRRL B-2516) TaxID=278992 RepID=A0ADN5_STRA7|nr:cytochrome c oxidase assembly protein [Streptomyces ambofaciens]AKZ59738.1 putative membrane protein [Streptomyces ambofaciens ATCC 23877]CAJ88592.1 putative membrane protein [Streptomyces ambofaciens ATCC 23877]